MSMIPIDWGGGGGQLPESNWPFSQGGKGRPKVGTAKRDYEGEV
jgi:hypothetical protein